jgi:hypothetical protein
MKVTLSFYNLNTIRIILHFNAKAESFSCSFDRLLNAERTQFKKLIKKNSIMVHLHVAMFIGNVSTFFYSSSQSLTTAVAAAADADDDE